MRRLRTILAAVVFVVASGAVPAPASAQSGTLIKGPLPAVYYVDEGKRYVFPNERVFFSWYGGFETVQTVSEAELASYPIGGNVTYKPASKLVKIQSDPRVYAVGGGGRLRWITSEAAAAGLYGADWNRKVDDIPDTFFIDYREGEPIASAFDFEMDAEGAIDAIADDLALRSGGTVVQDFTAVKSGVWTDASVWGGRRPGSGARVTIPVGVTVTYDMADAPSLKSLDVLGTLDVMAGRTTRLAARQITVRGALTAGTDEAPIPAGTSVTIALTGAATTAIGDDGLTVDGGTLSLHGAPVGASWTTLAEAAEAGDLKLTLAQGVAWPVGAEVALLGDKEGSPHEVRSIAALDGATLTLDAPLDAAHRSEPGLRSEIVLLDRNVTIVGVGEGAGSYVRGINRARVDLSSVALEKLGRKGTFGQYPLYLDGLTAPSVRGSVIRSAGNRCISLRQTTEAAIDGNAAFAVYGSCFATEDGAETGNGFTGNLAADIRGGALPGDAAPAGFLIRHPGNVLRDNMVVASAGFGYWYELPENAVKNSGTILKPREAALAAFERNGVRGARKTGLYVDDNDRGRMNYIPDDTAVFSGLSAVMSGEYGFWMRGAGLEVRDAYLAENGVGGSFAAFGATVRNATFEGALEGSGDVDGARIGFLFDDGPVSLLDATFRRFEGDSSAYGLRDGNARVPDPRSAFRRSVYDGDLRLWSAAPPTTAGDMMSVVRDADAGVTIAARSDFLDVDCESDESDNVMRCPRTYAQLALALRESPLNRPVTFTNMANGGSVTLEPGTAFDGEYAYANVAEGGSYQADIPNVPSVRVEYDGFTQPLLVRLPAGLGASVRKDGAPLDKTDLAELAPGGWGYDDSTSEAVLWLNPGEAFDLTR